MSAKDVYEHTRDAWQDEIEYAETLRGRRNIFSTGLMVITGLGVFQLSPFIDEDKEFVIQNPSVRWLITILILLALTLVVVGAYRLYTSGPRSMEEREIEESLEQEDGNEPMKIRRASELLQLRPDEEEAMVVSEGGGDAAWMMRAKKLQLSVSVLKAANRRVSNRIKSAGVLISLGFLALVAAVAVYTVGINFR